MTDRESMTLETAKKIISMHFTDFVPGHCAECPAYADPVCKGPDEAVKCILDHLDKAESVDAVEVVRCSECIRLRANKHPITGEVFNTCTKWPEHPLVFINDFCSYGERKDNRKEVNT